MHMKRLIELFVVLIPALWLAGCGETPALPPGGFSAHAQLDPATILPGEPVTLTLTARHPKGSVVVFPSVGSGKRTVVKHRDTDQRQLTEEILETKEVLELTSFRIGTWSVATNPVVCTFADGAEKRQALGDLTLTVNGSLTEEDRGRISDIRNGIKPGFSLPPLLTMILSVALLALLAGVLTLVLLRRKAGAGSVAPPPEPPQVIARRALDELKNSEWIPEPFFTRLSLILRTYLEGRFALNAPELTTEELTRRTAADDRLDEASKQSLENFMTQADLVKFARAGAEHGVMQTAFQTVEKFVNQTEPAEFLPQESTKKTKEEEGDG
jgi:hypothetical protein